MNKPLASVVLVYAAGLLWGQCSPPPISWLFAGTFAALAIAFIFERLRPSLLWALILCTGCINLAIHTRQISPADLRTILTQEPELVNVRGRLESSPTQHNYGQGENSGGFTAANLDVIQIHRGAGWQPAVGTIAIRTPNRLTSNYFAGQTVEIRGVISPPKPPVAAGLLDYQRFLRMQGIYFALKADPADWTLLSTNRHSPPVSDRFLHWAKATLAYGLPAIDEPVELLWAMTLGWRPGLTGEISAPFRESGTMHIFAISGLHIALIAGILIAILRVIQLPRAGCGMIIIPWLWFYTGVTGWQPSAIRATIMMSIVIGGWMLKQPSNLLNSLAAAALIILIGDPLQLFQASFQLSFCVVLSIALLMPALDKMRHRFTGRDPMLPPALVPRWRRVVTAFTRMILAWLSVSFAAWLGSWPLCAAYFHLFSPVTLLANLLVIPLAGAALACNVGSLICNAWFPLATELFNHSAWLWMSLMLRINQAVIQWPGAYFFVSGPGILDFIIYYAGLVAVLTGQLFRQKWRLPALVCLVAVGGFYVWRWHEARHTTTLTVLPLNGGSAVFVHDGQAANNLLVDCGNTNAANFVTIPFLHAQGINHLPRLVLTQGDSSDTGGAAIICDGFSANEVFTSPARFRSHCYREIMQVIDRSSGLHQRVQRGDRLGAWRVLHPAATNTFAQADDNSLVLMGQMHQVRVLMLSDLGRSGQADLLGHVDAPHADVVIAGLPEKSQPLNDVLLDAVNPRLIIIADSDSPATKRASPALMERLARRNVPVIYTRKAGAVTLVFKPGQWKLQTMDGQKWIFPLSPIVPGEKL